LWYYSDNMINRFEIGESVVVTPKTGDIFSHEFRGTVKGFRDNGRLITVKDQDGDCFDCEPSQVELLV